MKKVEVALDDKSIQILNELDSVHKQSIINFGIRLAENTDYYKILVGKTETIEISKLENALENKSENKTSNEDTKNEKPSSDVLDLGDFM